METFIRIKGEGQRLLTALAARGTYELLQYADGSHSIVRNEQVLGIWEPSETGDCILEFGRLAGLNVERLSAKSRVIQPNLLN